jgi:FkbM family methyltransferase
MNTFFDNKSMNDMGKVIHAGAGTGNNLNDYASQQFTDVLFLEPIPKLFKQLESKIIKFNETSTECNISALNAALCSSVEIDKEKNFYATQPHRYSSFHKASKLQTLFQNLKIEHEILVSTVSLAELIEKAVLDKDKKNLLVLQINGEEFNVIAKAKESELMLFSSIVIEQSKNDYFEQAKSSDDLIALMTEKGFQLAIESENDVVFRNLVFRKDESMIKLKILNEKSNAQAAHIVELESKLKANNEAKSSESTIAAEQNKNQSARITELENQLKASNEATSSESTKTAEQNKNQSARITDIENQLKASNEAKLSESAKAAEQNKNQSTRITEL